MLYCSLESDAKGLYMKCVKDCGCFVDDRENATEPREEFSIINDLGPYLFAVMICGILYTVYLMVDALAALNSMKLF